MEREKIIVQLEKYSVVLKMLPFDQELDVDELTKIQYDNLYGEYVTISTLLNRIGLLKAEAENIVRTKKHEVEIMEAEKRQYYAEQNSGKKLTRQQYDDLVTLDTEVRRLKSHYIKDQKTLDIVDALYWGVQSKSQKLGVLMKGVTPSEFENDLMDGMINGILIKKHKNIGE